MRAIVCMLVVLVCCSFVAEDSPAEDSPTVGRWKVRTDVITDGVRLSLTGCEPGATGKPLSLEDCGECWGALIVRCSGRGVTLGMLSHPLGFLGDEAFIDSTGEGQTSLLLVSESSVGDMTLRLDKEAVRIEPGWTFQRQRKVSKHRHKIPVYRRRIESERDVAESSAGLPLVRRLFSGQARKLAVRAKSPFSDEVWTLLFDISESKAAAGACLKVADELYEYEELLRDVREDSIDWHLF